jgi:hypothetical protein
MAISPMPAAMRTIARGGFRDIDGVTVVSCHPARPCATQAEWPTPTGQPLGMPRQPLGMPLTGAIADGWYRLVHAFVIVTGG